MYYAEAICISNYASYQTCGSGCVLGPGSDTQTKAQIRIRMLKEIDLEASFRISSDPVFKTAQMIILCFTPDLRILLLDPEPILKKSSDPGSKASFRISSVPGLKTAQMINLSFIPDLRIRLCYWIRIQFLK